MQTGMQTLAAGARHRTLCSSPLGPAACACCMRMRMRQPCPPWPRPPRLTQAAAPPQQPSQDAAAQQQRHDGSCEHGPGGPCQHGVWLHQQGKLFLASQLACKLSSMQTEAGAVRHSCCMQALLGRGRVLTSRHATRTIAATHRAAAMQSVCEVEGRRSSEAPPWERAMGRQDGARWAVAGLPAAGAVPTGAMATLPWGHTAHSPGGRLEPAKRGTRAPPAGWQSAATSGTAAAQRRRPAPPLRPQRVPC